MQVSQEVHNTPLFVVVGWQQLVSKVMVPRYIFMQATHAHKILSLTCGQNVLM